MQRKSDVELAGHEPPGNLGAEELAGDHGHVRAVVLDRGQDRAQRLGAGHRGVAEPDCSGDAGSGETGALGRALERGERQWRLVAERTPGGGEFDATARPDEQVGAQRALELVDLVAQRRLGDVQARGCPAEMQLLRDRQEVAQ